MESALGRYHLSLPVHREQRKPSSCFHGHMDSVLPFEWAKVLTLNKKIMMLRERNCQKGDNLGDIQACEQLLPTGQRKTQSCKAISNCPLYTSRPEKLPAHPEGTCQPDARYSSALLNPEVNAEMGRSAAATSKQREVVPVTTICSLNSRRIWLPGEIRTVEQRGQ